MPSQKETSEPPMRRLTIMIPQDLHEGLEDMAETNGGSVGEAVREAVQVYLMEHFWVGVGGTAEMAILGGKTNEEVLAEVRKRYPAAATTLRSISWYRSRLRKLKGEGKVPTDAGVKRMRERNPKNS